MGFIPNQLKEVPDGNGQCKSKCRDAMKHAISGHKSHYQEKLHEAIIHFASVSY